MLQKWGGSQGVRIPKQLLDEAMIKMTDKLQMNVEDGQIIISRANNNDVTIEALFKGYDEKINISENDWGVPEGKEIW